MLPQWKEKKKRKKRRSVKQKTKHCQLTQWNHGYLKRTPMEKKRMENHSHPPFLRLPPHSPSCCQPPNPQSAPRRYRFPRIRPCGHRRAPRRRARPARTQYGRRRARAARAHCAHCCGCANVILHLGSATGALLDRLELV